MKTQIINHAQGTQAWHLHRAQHLNASDAAAVLGLSSYKTRSQLLHEKATGFVKEIDAGTQHRFAKGHEYEAIARPWAEEIIGSELFPVVLAGEHQGLNLSASLDGVDMASDYTFEHKTGRADLLASLDRGVIPDEYHPQMEMGLMLSGASKCLFMASSGDKNEMRFAWYSPNLELRAQIIAAWHQFALDLAAYVPQEVTVAPVAAPQMGLPAVVIKVEGSIALVDNLPAIGVALNAYIASINKKPESDQDFANLEATVKHLKAFEEALGASEENALAQVGSVDAMRKTVALYRELASSNRLLVDKLVKAEKENRRTAIVGDAVAELVTHVRKLNERLGQPFMPNTTADFQGVIKGLKSLDSMKDKVATELARAKIVANAMADRIQANMQKLVAVGDKVSFPDAATLVLKAPDDLAAVIALRVAEADRKAEELRDSIRKEEAEKLAAAPVASAQAATETVAPTVTHADVVKVMMPATVRQAMAPAAARPTSTPTMALGEISTRLSFNVTSAFLATLGFEATTVRASKLYHEEDFVPICRALQEHIDKVVNLQNQLSAVAA